MMMEVRHAPWTVRLEKHGQFPDILYLLAWLRERVAVPRPPELADIAAGIEATWPGRRYEIRQDQKVGALIVEG